MFVCKSQLKHWQDKYSFLRGKAVVVYNGVDVDRFDPRAFVKEGREFRRSFEIADDVPVITCIAGFRVEKGHDDLLSAVSSVDQPVHLFLAGDGPCRHAIEEIVARKGMANVTLLGNVSDVRPLLAASNLTVLASTAVETFSIAMLESMAMSVPTVVTDIGGLHEAVIPGETGELVRPGKPDELGRVIGQLLQDTAKLAVMGTKACDRVKNDFSLRSMVVDTEQVLRTVMN